MGFCVDVGSGEVGEPDWETTSDGPQRDPSEVCEIPQIH